MDLAQIHFLMYVWFSYYVMNVMVILMMDEIGFMGLKFYHPFIS